VNVTDCSYNFSNEEMTRMGAEGHSYIYNQRKHRDQNNGYGRGCGGRHPSQDCQIQYVGNQTGGQLGNGSEQVIVPYDAQVQTGQTNQGSASIADHRSAQCRGGRAETGFGRGAYYLYTYFTDEWKPTLRITQAITTGPRNAKQ